MSQGVAWVDGRVVPLDRATVPVTDRGFLLGDAVFETLRTRGGRPFLVGDHLDRLRRSAGAVALPVPWTDGSLIAIIDELLPEPPFPDCVLRITLTRGDGGHGLAPPEPTRPRLVVLRRPLPDAAATAGRAGIAAVRDARPLGRDASVPAHVKHGGYLGAVAAIRTAHAAGAGEALVRGLDGGWIEGTTSNLLALVAGRLVAPGEEQGALPGITRALVLELAAEAGLSVEQRSLSDHEVTGADELLLTSTVKGIVPVLRLDGRPIGGGSPGPHTRALQEAFDAAVARLLLLRASHLRQLFAAR